MSRDSIVIPIDTTGQTITPEILAKIIAEKAVNPEDCVIIHPGSINQLGEGTTFHGGSLSTAAGLTGLTGKFSRQTGCGHINFATVGLNGSDKEKNIKNAEEEVIKLFAAMRLGRHAIIFIRPHRENSGFFKRPLSIPNDLDTKIDKTKEYEPALGGSKAHQREDIYDLYQLAIELRILGTEGPFGAKNKKEFSTQLDTYANTKSIKISDHDKSILKRAFVAYQHAKKETIQPQKQFNALKSKMVAELDRYINPFKFSLFGLDCGHHHNDRAKAVKSAILKAETINQLEEIIRTQLMLAETTPNISNQHFLHSRANNAFSTKGFFPQRYRNKSQNKIKTGGGYHNAIVACRDVLIKNTTTKEAFPEVNENRAKETQNTQTLQQR